MLVLTTILAEPRTEIAGEQELFVDSASSLNLTCLVKSPEPPAYVFWKKEGKVSLKYLAHAAAPRTRKVVGKVGNFVM